MTEAYLMLMDTKHNVGKRPGAALVCRFLRYRLHAIDESRFYKHSIPLAIDDTIT